MENGNLNQIVLLINWWNFISDSDWRGMIEWQVKNLNFIRKSSYFSFQNCKKLFLISKSFEIFAGINHLKLLWKLNNQFPWRLITKSIERESKSPIGLFGYSAYGIKISLRSMHTPNI